MPGETRREWPKYVIKEADEVPPINPAICAASVPLLDLASGRKLVASLPARGYPQRAKRC